MIVIVPLAGSDFIRPDGLVKGLELFNGEPLLKTILESRPWHSSSTQYYFIYQDLQQSRDFHGSYVQHWFRNSTATFIHGVTKGAALTTLVGLSSLDTLSQPFIVDLADIYFELEDTVFNVNPDVGGAAFTFESQVPHYSYLLFTESGEFKEAREKQVISERASAGAYYFKDFSVYIKALAWVISVGEKYLHNDAYYLCPLFNGISAIGYSVSQIDALNVKDAKMTA